MALHYERERFHTTLNTLPQAFIPHDRQWTVTYVDTAGATAFGHLADDLMGLFLKTVFPEADRSPVIQAARRMMKTGVSGHISTSSDSLGKDIEATVSWQPSSPQFTHRRARREGSAPAEYYTDRNALPSSCPHFYSPHRAD